MFDEDPKTAIMERAATFYEQELMTALEANLLTTSKEAILACLKTCRDEGKSFSLEFRKVVFADSWRKELKPVADKATERLQAWMLENKLPEMITPVVKYNHVDERGRAYKPTSLVAKTAPGYFFKVEHKPSVAASHNPSDTPAPSGDSDSPEAPCSPPVPLLVPVFGWVHDEAAMNQLVAQDRIAYGELPWDTAYQKNFLG